MSVLGYSLLLSLVLFFATITAKASHPCGASGILNHHAQASESKGSGVGFSILVVSPLGKILCEDHHMADRVIYPASAMKTLVAIATLRLVDRKQLDLNQSVLIDQVNADDECVLYGCDNWGKGKSRTLKQLLDAMLTVSNNIATNQLMDLTTKDYINTVAVQLGLTNTQVHRKVYAFVDPEPGINLRNMYTSRDLAKTYKFLYTQNTLWSLSQQSHSLLLDVLRRQTDHGQLNRDFPDDLLFIHKTGVTSRAAADGGYFVNRLGKIVILTALQENPLKIEGDRWDIQIHNRLGQQVASKLASWNDALKKM